MTRCSTPSLLPRRGGAARGAVSYFHPASCGTLCSACGRSAPSTKSAKVTPPARQLQFTPEVYGSRNRKISVSQIRKGLSRKERGTGAKIEETGAANQRKHVAPT